jgi:hypothetical protein
VFGDVPGQGRWPTVLVMDGNVGIGGDPLRLLSRLVSLLAPSGRLIVEGHPDPRRDERLRVRFAGAGGRATGPEFGWAQVGLDAIAGYAAAAGGRLLETWTAEGRPFALIVRG